MFNLEGMCIKKSNATRFSKYGNTAIFEAEITFSKWLGFNFKTIVVYSKYNSAYKYEDIFHKELCLETKVECELDKLVLQAMLNFANDNLLIVSHIRLCSTKIADGNTPITKSMLDDLMRGIVSECDSMCLFQHTICKKKSTDSRLSRASYGVGNVGSTENDDLALSATVLASNLLQDIGTYTDKSDPITTTECYQSSSCCETDQDSSSSGD